MRTDPFRPALLIWTLCLGLQAASRASNDEEYQVLRAFLASPYVEKVDYALYDRIGIYFIYNVNHERADNISGFFKQYANTILDPEMVKQFVAVNHRPQPIERKRFPATLKYSPQYIRKDVYSLSRVGFNAKKDEALIYASFSSLLEDGHGSLVYLKKTGGAWSVAKTTAVWMYGASVHPFNP